MGFKPLKADEGERKFPEQGRIRMGGHKQPKRSGPSLRKFRLTSHDKGSIERAAELWGGTCQPWEDQWEVFTEASELPVVLPPDPLGDTPQYEKWEGGGCERRCDGVVCRVPSRGPDGIEEAEQACICRATGTRECKAKTRLRVCLAGLPFGGVWRLETGSDIAAVELPGMVSLIGELDSRQGGSFTKAVIGIRAESSIVRGKKQNFIIPYLRIEASLAEIVAGEAGGALAAPQAQALTTGDLDDDEVVDGEIVGEDGHERFLQCEEARKQWITNDEIWQLLLDLVGISEDVWETNEQVDRIESVLAKLEVGTHSLDVIDGELKLRRTNNG